MYFTIKGSNLSELIWQIFEKKYVDPTYICGHYDDVKVGETLSNGLYVQFYSDNSLHDRGFNISYTQLKGMFLATLKAELKRSSCILYFLNLWVRFQVSDLMLAPTYIISKNWLGR